MSATASQAMTGGSGPELVRIKVSCHCGACSSVAHVPATSLPLTTNACICNSCRYHTGSLYYGSIDWPVGVPQEVKLIKFTRPKCQYYFCADCGAIMFWTGRDGSSPKASGGAIDEPRDAFRLTGFEFVSDSLDGGLSDIVRESKGSQLHRYHHEEYTSKQLPVGWRATTLATEGLFDQHEALQAKCLCGQLDFLVSRPKQTYTAGDKFGGNDVAPPWLVPRGERFVAGLCACTSCRKTSGVDVTSWVWTPKVNILNRDGSRFIPANSAALTTYESSAGVRRYFCNRCGATMGCELDIRPALIDIAAGLLHSNAGALNEDFLEWTHGVSFVEDAVNPTLVEAVADGYDEWRQRRGLLHMKSVRPHGFVNPDAAS